jgi:hypothetical protein
VHAAILAEQARDLEEVQRAADANIAKLKAAGEEVTWGQVATIHDAWARAWLGADPQKRRVLRHAFAKAFDPDLYQSGVLIELLQVVDRLLHDHQRAHPDGVMWAAPMACIVRRFFMPSSSSRIIRAQICTSRPRCRALLSERTASAMQTPRQPAPSAASTVAMSSTSSAPAWT